MIKQRRLAVGLTQQQLADACASNCLMIRRLENGVWGPRSIPIMFRAMHHLGLHLMYTAGDSDGR
jgi:transcriptional regulator with XRE-family HTH domain